MTSCFAIYRELNRGHLTIKVKYIYYKKKSSDEDFNRKIKLEENKTVLNTWAGSCNGKLHKTGVLVLLLHIIPNICFFHFWDPYNKILMEKWSDSLREREDVPYGS